MIKPQPYFRCENIPNRIISKSVRGLKPSDNLSSKFNWIRDMLNNSKDINTTIPDIIAKSSSLVNSHKKSNQRIYIRKDK